MGLRRIKLEKGDRVKTNKDLADTALKILGMTPERNKDLILPKGSTGTIIELAEMGRYRVEFDKDPAEKIEKELGCKLLWHLKRDDLDLIEEIRAPDWGNNQVKISMVIEATEEEKAILMEGLDKVEDKNIKISGVKGSYTAIGYLESDNEVSVYFKKE